MSEFFTQIHTVVLRRRAKPNAGPAGFLVYLETAVTRVARSPGPAFRKYDTDVRALAFEAPGWCRPAPVISLAVTFDKEPLLRSARGQDEVLRYFDIDRTWEKPDRLPVEQLK